MAPILTLAELAPGAPATVHKLHGPPTSPDWPQRLQDLGFVPGENVVVLRRSTWGGDRLVVRVGASTFALRRAEAGCVQVQRSAAVKNGAPSALAS